MRTTVTLDADTEQIVRERMAAKGVGFKKALNDAIREAAAGRRREPFSTPVHRMGTPSVDLTKAMQLAGDLEDDEIAATLRSDR
ncbi:MAG: antitoxin [Phycicoccus sp.]